MQSFLLLSHITANKFNGADHGTVNDQAGSTDFMVVFDSFGVWYTVVLFALHIFLSITVTFTYIMTYLAELPGLSSAVPLEGPAIRVPGFSVYCHAITNGFA